MPAKKTSQKTSIKSQVTGTKKDSMTGKYVFDKKLNKVVKVSDRIPGLKKSGGEEPSPCDSGSCDTGMGGCGPMGCGGMGGLGGCGGMGGMGGF